MVEVLVAYIHNLSAQQIVPFWIHVFHIQVYLIWEKEKLCLSKLCCLLSMKRCSILGALFCLIMILILVINYWYVSNIRMAIHKPNSHVVWKENAWLMEGWKLQVHGRRLDFWRELELERTQSWAKRSIHLGASKAENGPNWNSLATSRSGQDSFSLGHFYFGFWPNTICFSQPSFPSHLLLFRIIFATLKVFFIYLEGKITEIEREHASGFIHWFSKWPMGKGWARLKPGGKNFICMYHKAAGTQYLGYLLFSWRYY